MHAIATYKLYVENNELQYVVNVDVKSVDAGMKIAHKEIAKILGTSFYGTTLHRDDYGTNGVRYVMNAHDYDGDKIARATVWVC